MINRRENISAGVYWDDTGVPGSKLSGCSTQGKQSVLKTVKSTVEVHSV
jgi:hypothetical protein